MSSPSVGNKRKSTDGCLDGPNSESDDESTSVSITKKRKLSGHLAISRSEHDEDPSECSEVLGSNDVPDQVIQSSSSSMDSNGVSESGNHAGEHNSVVKNVPDSPVSSTVLSEIPGSKSSESVSASIGSSVSEVTQGQLSLITASQTGDLDTIRRLLSK
eukprot:822741_1